MPEESRAANIEGPELAVIGCSRTARRRPLSLGLDGNPATRVGGRIESDATRDCRVGIRRTAHAAILQLSRFRSRLRKSTGGQARQITRRRKLWTFSASILQKFRKSCSPTKSAAAWRRGRIAWTRRSTPGREAMERRRTQRCRNAPHNAEPPPPPFSGVNSR